MRQKSLFEDNLKGACFSADGKHRLSLWRIWDEHLPKAMCIGLNPSNANADKDDPTISNLRKALAKLGFGGVIMMNCFTIISSKPSILQDIDINDPENTDNQYNIGHEAEQCEVVIFAWGTFKAVAETGIDKRWIEMFPKAKCFGHNQDRTPIHPMFLMWSGKINNPELIPYI